MANAPTIDPATPVVSLHLTAGADGMLTLMKPACRRFPHRHRELELNVVVSGKGSYILGDRRYELHPRSIVWLFPGQPHVLADVSPDMTLWVLVFSRSLVEQVAGECDEDILREESPVGSFARRLSLADSRTLEEVFASVLKAGDDLTWKNQGLVYSLITGWRLFERSNELDYRSVHPSVEKAVLLLQSHYSTGTGRRLPGVDLAKNCGLSFSRLSRVFKAETGVTISEFANQLRLERFEVLFQPGRTGMLETALRAGFGSYAQFHRVFRKDKGMGPREFFRE